ncbi:MAG TPA: glycosyltransferase, partial [Planctomycetota bacterium]|nr:glycosyltransferase [Planctomycetota bacterium]
MQGPVLLCGAWDEGPGYPRTAALRAALASSGIAFAECRAAAMGQGKQGLLRAPWRWPLWWLADRWRRRRFRSRLRQAIAAVRPRVLVVPYPGHLYVRDVRRLAQVPVVLDLFLSAYDTAVEDRRLFAAASLPARLLRWLDRRACAAADLVLLDTPEHAAHTALLTGLPVDRFDWLPVSDPEAPMVPAPYPEGDGALRLLFFGTGVPLHGLRTLLLAVAQVETVVLTLVGGTASDRAYAGELLGRRLLLQPEFVDRARLQQLLDHSELVAGVFGTSDKVARVVPFKVMHALAAGRPVLTADTPAMRRIAEPADGVFYVPAGDVAATAAVLAALAGDRAR